jgi:hypothetical protein
MAITTARKSFARSKKPVKTRSRGMSSRVIQEPAFPIATLKMLIEQHFRALSFINDDEDVVSIELKKVDKGLVDLKVHLVSNKPKKGCVIHLV